MADRDNDSIDALLTDLADGLLSGMEWDTWLAENPDAAQEVAIAQRVRSLLTTLQETPLEVSPDFESQLFAYIYTDTTLLTLFDLGFEGWGHVLLELFTAIFDFLPEPPTTSSSSV
ncbi:MAG: hypothetical protein AAGF95_06865 [Chloroflexota bacterium]